jgi:hypothetical protein
MMHTGRLVRNSLVMMLCWCALSCGRRGDPERTPVHVRGTERIAWTQQAASLQEFKKLTYKIYIDGQASPISDTQCGSSPTASGYPCSARLPPLRPGQHAIELRSVLNGQESPPSSELLIDVSPAS